LEVNEKKLDALLSILGNRTRRQILQLLAEEPHYLLQLSKELDVSQQAILKHLALLEKHGFVSSYEKESDLGAPPRKYYHLNSAVYLTIGLAGSLFRIRAMPLLEVKPESASPEMDAIRTKIEELRKMEDALQKIRFSNNLLAQIDEKLKKIDDEKVSLLHLRQEVQGIANDAIRQASETRLEKRILYSILGSSEAPSPEILSVKLDVRERTIEDALKELEKRGLVKTKAKSPQFQPM